MNDNQGVINFKIKFFNDDALQEMRRFTIDDATFASNFDLFKEKLRAVFPQLRTNTFKVTWSDADNDVITIANDEDLITAIMEMDGVKMLNVHIGKHQEEDEQDDLESEPVPSELYHITCDVCNNRITRYRYKCLQCPDYDLCLKCEQAGNHSHHIMMRLADLMIPRSLPKIIGHMSHTARKAAHHAAKEAHRAAKTGARAAQAAAGYARDRCYKGKRYGSTGQCPVGTGMMDGGVLFDLAESFLGSFTHGQTGQGASTTTPQGGSASASTSNTAGQQQQQQRGPQQGQQSGGGEQPPITPDVFGNVLRNIFSAINANLPQGATPASTGGTTTPVNIPTPADTPVGGQTPAGVPTSAQSAAQADDVVYVGTETTGRPDPVQVQVTASSVPPVATPAQVPIPMDVEHDRPLYPNLFGEQQAAKSTPSAPDAGWTFIPPSVSTTVAATTRTATTTNQTPAAAPLRAEDAKYAEALEQLRRMGFSESVDLLGLLKRYDGNIGFVVNHLFENTIQK